MEVLVKILKKLGLYDFAKKTYIKRRKRQNLKGKYKFINRSKNNKKMCMILAGYKTFSYEIVFKRIKKFIECMQPLLCPDNYLTDVDYNYIF